MGKAYEDFQKRQAWIQSEDDALVRINQPKQELSESFPLLDTLVVEPLPQVKIVEPAALPMQAQAPSTDTRKSWEQSLNARVARGDDKGAAEAKKQIRKIELAEKAAFIAKARELKNLAKHAKQQVRLEEKLGKAKVRQMNSNKNRILAMMLADPAGPGMGAYGNDGSDNCLCKITHRFGSAILTLRQEGYKIDTIEINKSLSRYIVRSIPGGEGCSDGKAA